MKIKFRFCLFIAVVFLTACSGKDESIDYQQPNLQHLPKNAVILAYGDGITSGAGSNHENSYPTILEKLIGYKVINAGVQGELTSESLKRLPGYLKQYDPSLVILCVGGIDMLKKHTAAEIKNNISEMIKLIQSQNRQLILLAPPQPTVSLTPPKLYLQLGKEYNIPVNTTLLAELYRHPKYKERTIHLNKVGNHRLAAQIAEWLRQLHAIDG